MAESNSEQIRRQEEAQGQTNPELSLSSTRHESGRLSADTWRQSDSSMGGHEGLRMPGGDEDEQVCQQATPFDNVGLLFYNREPLRLKDFASEVRAPLDVEQFAHQAELVLDVDTVSMGEIVDLMLTKVRLMGSIVLSGMTLNKYHSNRRASICPLLYHDR